MAVLVVGLFDLFVEAQRAIEELIKNGFAQGDIRLVASATGVAEAQQAGDNSAATLTGSTRGVFGLLGGISVLTLPGIGPVVADSTLAAELETSSADASAPAGRLGPLVAAGMRAGQAESYAEGLRRGGTLVLVHTTEEKPKRASSVMRLYGSVNIDERASEWRQSGWSSFSPGVSDTDEIERDYRGSTYGDQYRPQTLGDERGGRDSETNPESAWNGPRRGQWADFYDSRDEGDTIDARGARDNVNQLSGPVGQHFTLGDEAIVKSPSSNAPQNSATRSVERAASAQFPPTVEPESENLLTFTIGRRTTTANATAITFEAPAEAKEATLIVSVQTSDFDVLDPATGATRNWDRITLNLEDNAAEVSGEFLLRAPAADAPLTTTIYLRFSYNRAPVGRIAITTTIAPKAAGTPVKRRRTKAKGALKLSFDAAPGPDVVIHVNEHDDDRFQITVDQTTKFFGKSMGDFPTKANAWQYAQDMLEDFRMARRLPDDQRTDLINALGIDFWWQLPEDFRDFYWEEMHGRELSIIVNSQEPYIPWELIKPQRKRGGEETADMFGVAFSIGRWKDGRPLPNPLIVSDFVVIAPEYIDTPLKYTKNEAAELKRRFGARLIAGEYAPVSQLLKSKGVQAVHFAGHGLFDPASPGKSEIKLADHALKPAHVSGATLGGSDRPLVFLNACEVGREGWSLTQIGGWAEVFCEIGFSAFIGPYWAVDDRVAKKVSLLFYTELRAGKTMGKAMQEIRRHFWNDDEFRFHPTWLAYSLHCQPNVTVAFQRPR